jgi:cell division protein FtsB
LLAVGFSWRGFTKSGSAAKQTGDSSPHSKMPDSNEQADTHFSWTISMAFWLALLAAIGMYALVALSPKVLTYIQLRQDYQSKQRRLVSIEHEVEDLGQVVDSLTSDPEFVRKLASVEFGARRPGEERIPLDEHLQLSIRDNDPVFETPADSLPWYGSVVAPFATSQQLRGTMLLAAATILIGAFMFLQPSLTPATTDEATAKSNRPAALLARYRRSH